MEKFNMPNPNEKAKQDEEQKKLGKMAAAAAMGVMASATGETALRANMDHHTIDDTHHEQVQPSQAKPLPEGLTIDIDKLPPEAQETVKAIGLDNSKINIDAPTGGEKISIDKPSI
jgi:hypothetical protein